MMVGRSRHVALLVLLLFAVIGLALAGCPGAGDKKKSDKYRVEKSEKKKPAPTRKKPRPKVRKHAAHPHGNGGHPHKGGAHHHHLHPHPHLDGSNGHHHP